MLNDTLTDNLVATTFTEHGLSAHLAFDALAVHCVSNQNERAAAARPRRCMSWWGNAGKKGKSEKRGDHELEVIKAAEQGRAGREKRGVSSVEAERGVQV